MLKLWVPITFAAIVVLAYTLLYVMSSLEPQGDASFWLVNTLGLMVVAIGVVAAGFILRRASPP